MNTTSYSQGSDFVVEHPSDSTSGTDSEIDPGVRAMADVEQPLAQEPPESMASRSSPMDTSSIDVERAESRIKTSPTTDSHEGEICNRDTLVEMSTKPTYEESIGSDIDDDDFPDTIHDDPGVSTDTAADVEAVSAVSTAPCGVGQAQSSVRVEKSFTDEPITSFKATADADACVTPERAPREVGCNAAGSPAESTLATEPTTPRSTVTIEHRHVNKTGRSSTSRLLGMRKPIIALLGLYLVGITGASAFLAQQFLTIPGLNAQIEELGKEVDRLEEQVDRLEGEVDRLAEQVDRLEDANDRFEQLNDELEANNEEYSRQNDRLEASNSYYAELNGRLNISNNELELLNKALNASNAEYSRLNAELTKTTEELNEQVDVLQVVNSNLTDTLIEYVKLSDGLSNETDRLDRLNDDLADNLLNLNKTLSGVRQENNRLNFLIDDLTTVTSFLNETANTMEQTYEAIAEFLANQIVANRAILSETLHNTYRQQTSSWVTGFSIRFATEPFSSDGTVPIGSSAFPQVMDYVDKNVLSDLCLDASDFESFLALRVGSPPPSVNATLNDLIPAVMMYTSDALDYYFPDAGEIGGLTEADWSDSSFRCKRLPVEKKFLYEKAL